MGKRDEFTAVTKRTLALRAAYFCSNPNCFKLTTGPHSDQSKSLLTGHAGHIYAAAPNGPRYNINQLPAERRDISNGIWLCRECGDLVDKDISDHSADQLRQWKYNHEALISEVRKKGYSQSVALLQSGALEPRTIKAVIDLFEDRRALWVSFDAEFPDRVRQSLDYVRSEIVKLRSGLQVSSPVYKLLVSLGETVRTFFDQVEHIDLKKLTCDAQDRNWCLFRDALAALRKTIGIQIKHLTDAHDISVGADLQSIMPI